MVWGCMGSNVVGNLEFIESKMKKIDYLNTFLKNLKATAQKLGVSDDFYFQQDNNPKHTAYIVRLWLLYHGRNQLHTSSQCSYFKHNRTFVGFTQTDNQGNTIISKDMLKSVMIEERNKIITKDASRLVESMPNRLREVIKKKIPFKV